MKINLRFDVQSIILSFSSLLNSLNVSIHNNTDTCLSKEDTVYRHGSLHIDRSTNKPKHTSPACFFSTRWMIGCPTPIHSYDKMLEAAEGGECGSCFLASLDVPSGDVGLRGRRGLLAGGDECVAVCCIKPQWRCQRHPWRHYGNQIVGSDLRLPWRRHVQRWALLPPGRPQGPSAHFILSRTLSLSDVPLCQSSKVPYFVFMMLKYTSVTMPITSSYKSTAWAELYIRSYGSPHSLYTLPEIIKSKILCGCTVGSESLRTHRKWQFVNLEPGDKLRIFKNGNSWCTMEKYLRFLPYSRSLVTLSIWTVQRDSFFPLFSKHQ